ncbi:hypothetical protein Droror1_Dr00014494 [Drosera rotundifolia]
MSSSTAESSVSEMKEESATPVFASEFVHPSSSSTNKLYMVETTPSSTARPSSAVITNTSPATANSLKFSYICSSLSSPSTLHIIPTFTPYSSNHCSSSYTA